MGARVLMVVHSYFPRDVRVRRMARACVRAGLEVEVLALQGEQEAKKERWQGIQIQRLPVRRHRGAPLPIYLAEYLAFAGMVAAHLGGARSWDLVHLHTPPDFLGLAGLPARLGGAKLVVDIHDLSPELYQTRFHGLGGRLAYGLLTSAERAACSVADRVVTVTEVFAERLIARGLPAEKLQVIFNCPDEEIFKPRPKRKAGRKNGPFRIVHHGTLVHRYGVDVLLDAVGLLLSEGRNLSLDIYGEGDARPSIEAQAAEAPWAGRVKLHGDRSQETVAEALAGAELCVVPNRNDPFTDLLLPTKLLEAMRVGCPAVASATSSIRRYVGEGALLVPPGDLRALARAMADLMDDPERLQVQSRRGREQVMRFSWRDEQEKLLKLYEELGVVGLGDAGL